MVKEKSELTENRIVLSETPHKDAEWYVVHTYSGHESKVAVTLQQRVESMGLEDVIDQILLPTQEKIVISEGKKRAVDEKLFPGYILVHMVLNDDNWHVIRSTSGETGFVGAGSKPTPLPQNEVDSILKFMKMDAPKFETQFSLGDSVKITDGPFQDFIGKVDEVDENKGKVKVLVSVFGRETPVELDFLQVAPL